MRIYLADLGHNILTYSSDTFPLGIANIASYTNEYFEAPSSVTGIAKSVDIKLFREPEKLKAAIDKEFPDVLGLSNYAWNEELAYHFACYLKNEALTH